MRTESERTSTRLSYDVVAGRYAAEIGTELAEKPLDRSLLMMMVELAGAGLIADIGCGPGHVAEFLADSSARTVGLDLSLVMCVIGAQKTAIPFCVADMTALPIASSALSGIVCYYAVIHLGTGQRAAAYREFARTLAPGGHALIAFHTSDADVPVGGSKTLTNWWGLDVALTFRYLDPAVEVPLLQAAGLRVMAQVDREPYSAAEHPSRRCYLLAQRPEFPLGPH